ncbi:MAG: thermonuclease family protein [Phycisphaerae bacterium]|nr:thermonuclease family protein [Phycisphaerae bacterium]
MAKRPNYHYRKMTARRRRLRYVSRRVLPIACLVLLGIGLHYADRAGLFGRRQEADYLRYHGKTFSVVKCIDGDTIDINIPDGDHPHTRIRLWGVDTPETVKPNHRIEHFGLEASAFTRRATYHKQVRLELLPGDTRGKYGRLLAYVYLPDGTMLNRRLIAHGRGYADPRFKHPRRREFVQEMARAKAARQGLWENPKPDDLPYYLRRH